MTTLSVPINEKLEKFIASQIADGKAENKAEVVRRALTHFAEHQAYMDILEAEQDIKEGRVYVYKDAESFEKHLREMYD